MNHSQRLAGECILISLLAMVVLAVNTGILAPKPCIASSSITKILYNLEYDAETKHATLYLANGLHVTTKRANVYEVGDMICTKRGVLRYEEL